MTRALGIDVDASGARAAIVKATKSVIAYAAEAFARVGAGPRPGPTPSRSPKSSLR